MTRKKIIAGNWKMNLTYAEAMALTDAVSEASKGEQITDIILSPSFVFLHDVVNLIRKNPALSVAAQNCSENNTGAYTGEVSSTMLASIGVDYVIIGHSERRKFFQEENQLLAEKINRAIEQSLLPIYCCGETLEQRNEKKQVEIVKNQLETGLFHLNNQQIKDCVIAYEPVWAIGTGVNASPDQAQEMHQFIREFIREKYSDETSNNMSILYGGSVTSKNAGKLFSCPDVDGGLVGGASLKADEFLKIVDAMEKLVKE